MVIYTVEIEKIQVRNKSLYADPKNEKKLLGPKLVLSTQIKDVVAFAYS